MAKRVKSSCLREAIKIRRDGEEMPFFIKKMIALDHVLFHLYIALMFLTFFLKSKRLKGTTNTSLSTTITKNPQATKCRG